MKETGDPRGIVFALAVYAVVFTLKLGTALGP